MTHESWYIEVTDTKDGEVAVVPASIAEFQFRESQGGADTVDSYTSGGGDWSFLQSTGDASLANDNNASSDWVCGFGAELPQGVGFFYGAGEGKEIVEIAITASLSTPGTAPRSFILHYSDDGGSTLTAVKTFIGEADWSAGEQRVYEIAAAVPAPRRAISMPWGLRASRAVELPWINPVAVVKSLPWGNGIRRQVATPWRALGSISRQVFLPFSLTTNARLATALVWRVLDVDTARKQWRLNWSARSRPGALVLPVEQQLKVVETGEILKFETASLQADEASWAWRMSLTMADVVGWRALRPAGGPVEIEMTVRGTVFKLLCEGAGRSRKDASTGYTIKGRSITARLAKGNADQVTKTWLGSTAKTIALELCSAAGITLLWQTVDWPIVRFEAVKRYPIDIISQLAKSAGGVAQSAPDGTLQIRPKYPVSPALYAGSVVDHSLSDIDDIETMSERWEARPGYDSIEVGNEVIRSEPSISISTDDAGGGAVLVKAFVVPFQAVNLEHSGGANIGLDYQGIKTETITQTLEILEGRGRLSSPFYGLISSEYHYVDLGAIDISEDGEISTAIGLHSLLKITYTTKYHTWRATSKKDQAQLYIEDVS